jgi:NADPH:quinone reductase-like Zn-dependent oxidoreductase
MPTNRAVWLPSKRADFEVGAAPYASPRENEIVVRNKAVAVNAIDWITQSMGDVFFPWTKYPFVVGSDLAGEVVEVGSGVSRFTVGDRVLAHAVGADKKRNSAAEGAFQDYTVVLEHMASPIPDTMAFENAVVLPLTLSTAACALFEKDQLALRHPSAQPKPIGETLLVWGGSTSLGSNAIQLAVAAGYDVVTTASPRNFAYVKGLGASQVFDRQSRTAVRDIKRALRDRTIAGAVAIGAGSINACLDIVRASKGNRFVSVASTPVSFENAPRGGGRLLWLIPTMARVIGSTMAMMIRSRLRGIQTKFIFGTSLFDNEVGPMIYRDFLPGALAEGRYRAAPEPNVFGRGLDAIPAAIEANKKGVSASKLVVLL